MINNASSSERKLIERQILSRFVDIRRTCAMLHRPYMIGINRRLKNASADEKHKKEEIKRRLKEIAKKEKEEKRQSRKQAASRRYVPWRAGSTPFARLRRGSKENMEEGRRDDKGRLSDAIEMTSFHEAVDDRHFISNDNPYQEETIHEYDEGEEEHHVKLSEEVDENDETDEESDGSDDEDVRESAH